MHIGPLVKFARANWPALLLLGVSSLALLWFALSFVLHLIYFNDPKHQDEALKPWMTPRYVVMSYDLPKDVVAEVLNLPESGPGRKKLGVIADDMGVTLEELARRVREAAFVFRAETP